MPQKTAQLELPQNINPIPHSGSYLIVFVSWLQELLSWWYIAIPEKIVQLAKRFVVVTNDILSISVIAKNLFSPWKRDRNLAGWVVGITIKILYLPIVVALTLLGLLIFIVALIVWLFIPPLTIAYIVIGPVIA